MYERSKTICVQAGKVIIAVSVILWVLSIYGPGIPFRKDRTKISATIHPKHDADSLARVISTEKLENSYAGVFRPRN
jgi:ferrous iron transport protein B